MGYDINETMRFAFFQEPDRSGTLAEERLARENKNDSILRQVLFMKYMEEEELKWQTRISKRIEALGKFTAEVNRLTRYPTLSITHDMWHKLREVTSKYIHVLNATIAVGSSNAPWLYTRGAYMLMHGLSVEQMNKLGEKLKIKVQSILPGSFIGDLAKDFFCAIEYEAKYEMDKAVREIFMFDGTKVFEEKTDMMWDDENARLVLKNKDYKKKTFQEVVGENLAKALINLDMGVTEHASSCI